MDAKILNYVLINFIILGIAKLFNCLVDFKMNEETLQKDIGTYVNYKYIICISLTHWSKECCKELVS